MVLIFWTSQKPQGKSFPIFSLKDMSSQQTSSALGKRKRGSRKLKPLLEDADEALDTAVRQEVSAEGSTTKFTVPFRLDQASLNMPAINRPQTSQSGAVYD